MKNLRRIKLEQIIEEMKAEGVIVTPTMVKILQKHIRMMLEV